MSDEGHGSTAIITPIYRSALTSVEQDLVHVTGEVSAHSRFFVIPEGMDQAPLREKFPKSEIVSTDPRNLASIHNYNHWMTSSHFYGLWSDFHWLLISQLDALLMEDPWQLMGPSDVDWDYLGAPWSPPLRVVTQGARILVRSPSGSDRGPAWVGLLGRRLRVGNGGLSLRRQETFFQAARRLESSISPQTRQRTHEDVLWAAFGPRWGVRFASVDQAAQVFWESTDHENIDPDEIPRTAGYHAVDKWPARARTHVIQEACLLHSLSVIESTP